MKKLLQLIGLSVFALVALLIVQGKVYARISGTNPTPADALCAGAPLLEVCIDGAANVVPTTTLTGSLGTSSLQWTTVRADDIVAGDNATSRLHAVVGVTSNTLVTTAFSQAGDIFIVALTGIPNGVVCRSTGTGIGAIVISSAPATPCRDTP